MDLLAGVPTNSRRVDFRHGRRLGHGDRVVRWRKGPRQSQWLSPDEWAALPEQMEVRIVRAPVRQRGFRTRELTLVTTLLDGQLYPAAELLATYARRWRLELCFDAVKPPSGWKASNVFPRRWWRRNSWPGSSHNLLRCVMAQAAQTHAVALERISFKGALDTLRAFNHALCQTRCARRKKELWAALLLSLARD